MEKLKSKKSDKIVIKKIKRILGRIRQNVLYHLPKKYLHEKTYYKVLNKKLNLKNPKDFNEKIQYLILYKYGKKEAELTDKYLVRKYVESKGCSENLVKLYGKYSNADEIDFSQLPEEFVLKTNHGCGNVFICKNKSEFNIKSCREQLNSALKKNFAKQNFEYHYKYIKPCIICEEYLKDKNYYMPIDYKIYCFNGKAECILVCSEREKDLRLDYYDLNWRYLDYAKDEYRSSTKLEKPKNLSKMIGIAEKLAGDNKFVRVDLYNIEGKIYFGELTFTPCAGTVYYNTQKALDYLGEKLEIN